ncbi:GNAT family N-acetyltransferase [uncultured Thalassospira sp.]|mgnify:FL=1|uniref:GNAT family N-acetyltransferase n=1 Tax=uncultured Thalassospira sp. TaxID=404382 RepID=UPI002584F016|nr:GNAT family N-acetyltransferase [uncultured Thalassospira sp.]
MLEVLNRQHCSKALWNQAADDIDNAWAWHRWELLEARSNWARTNDLSFAIVDRQNDSKLVALIPLVAVQPQRAQLLLGPHLESTGGPAVNDKLPRRTQDKVRALIAQEIKNLALYAAARRVDLSCPPLAPNLLLASHPCPNPLCHFGYSDTSTQSWLVNIAGKSESEIWSNLEHRCRKQIKKAERNQLSANLVEPAAPLLDHYYALHLETCSRNGIPPHPRGYFESIFGEVAEAGLSKCCIVQSGPTILAIHTFLLYKNKALYWTTAGSNDALKLCANDFGIWHAITEFSKSSIDYLECGEAFPGAADGKLKGLNDFKKSFGGTLYPYFRGQVIYRPVTESLMNIARHLRQGRTKK